EQRRDRRAARRQPDDGQDPREPGDGEGARPRPRPARRLRLRVRAGPAPGDAARHDHRDVVRASARSESGERREGHDTPTRPVVAVSWPAQPWPSGSSPCATSGSTVLGGPAVGPGWFAEGGGACRGAPGTGGCGAPDGGAAGVPDGGGGAKRAVSSGRTWRPPPGCSLSAGRCPRSADSEKGRPERSPAAVASEVACRASLRAWARASSGSCRLVSASPAAMDRSWAPKSTSAGGPESSSSAPPPPGAPPPKPRAMVPSAAVNSVGMTKNLLESLLASSGSICRYW